MKMNKEINTIGLTDAIIFGFMPQHNYLTTAEVLEVVVNKYDIDSPSQSTFARHLRDLCSAGFLKRSTQNKCGIIREPDGQNRIVFKRTNRVIE